MNFIQFFVHSESEKPTVMVVVPLWPICSDVLCNHGRQAVINRASVCQYPYTYRGPWINLLSVYAPRHSGRVSIHPPRASGSQSERPFTGKRHLPPYRSLRFAIGRVCFHPKLQSLSSSTSLITISQTAGAYRVQNSFDG